MTLVATLISPALTEAAVARAAAHLRATATRWLSADRAVDLAFDGDEADCAAVEAELRALLGAAPVDLLVQPEAGRRKRLLIADMDSTMIGQECIDELGDELGLKAHIAEITERAMRGEIAFEPALRERVALLKGLPVAVVAKVLAARITLTPGARTLIQTMRTNGAHCALVSGGFTLFTGPVAAMIGFHENRANVLEVADGLLAGTVTEPILGAEAKLASLRELTAAHGLDRTETLAVGDGANDLPMIRAAGLGVAYRAKPKVAAEARARVDHGDLTALLYFQGYGDGEFVAG